MRKTLILVTILVLLSGAQAADLTVEILDGEGNIQSAELEVLQDGETLDQEGAEGEVIDVTLEPGEEYTLKQEIEGVETTIFGFSIGEDLDMRPRILDLSTPDGEDFLTDLEPFYFNNQSESFEFEEASINVEREEPDRIARCKDFEDLNCLNWQVNDTQDYESNAEDGFEFNVTEFSAYSSGNQAPNPELEKIEVFNVTGLEDQRDGGEKIGEGTEKLEIRQESVNEYRFEFEVSNQGSEKWTLTQDDLLRDSGLDSGWTVEEEQIYYLIEEEFDGGSFQEVEVEWNTGEGGELEPGESMSAEYIVEIEEPGFSQHEKTFVAETTSGTETQQDYTLETVKTGEISDITIDRPEDDSVIQNNREFILNGTVTCVDGSCGEVEVEPRTNTTGSMTSIQDPDVDKFEVVEDRSECDLTVEDTCEVEWDVNATGDPDSFHEIDLKASSEYEEVETESSEIIEVEIQDVLMIDVTPEEIDFGLLDPGDSMEPADVNEEGHKVEVQEESNTVDNLWLKASSLVHEEEDQYSIAPGNLSYNEENHPGESESLSSDFTDVGTDLGPGSVKTFYYWLDVPLGILRGHYSGTLTFKVNSTS